VNEEEEYGTMVVIVFPVEENSVTAETSESLSVRLLLGSAAVPRSPEEFVATSFSVPFDRPSTSGVGIAPTDVRAVCMLSNSLW
jgi:hypothetical protein